MTRRRRPKKEVAQLTSPSIVAYVAIKSSSTYSRAGVHREDWRVGEEVTMTCLAAKDHSKHWGFLKQIKYHSDGHVLVFRLGGE